MTRDYRTLDAVVICATLAMLAAGGAALVFVEIPQSNLAVFASLLSLTGAAVGTYTAWRWASGAKKPEPPGTTVSTPPGPSTVTVETQGGEKG